MERIQNSKDLAENENTFHFTTNGAINAQRPCNR